MVPVTGRLKPQVNKSKISKYVPKGLGFVKVEIILPVLTSKYSKIPSSAIPEPINNTTSITFLQFSSSS